VKIPKGVFLDRDGTLNEDVGDLDAPGKLHFIPRAVDALKMLQEHFFLFVITNQSGIGEGRFGELDYARVNAHLLTSLEREGVRVQAVRHCPHAKKDRCVCHKPSPYFVEELCRKYEIDVRESFCVGDHPHDIEMARRCGARSVYLLTGHGAKHRKELIAKPDRIAADLYDAAVWITHGSIVRGNK
jgi:D-glycero-D-manno-heptose 1,7-bisphosphate phosphatase